MADKGGRRMAAAALLILVLAVAPVGWPKAGIAYGQAEAAGPGRGSLHLFVEGAAAGVSLTVDILRGSVRAIHIAARLGAED